MPKLARSSESDGGIQPRAVQSSYVRHSSVSGLSLQYSSSGSTPFYRSRAWLAAALSSSTSSHAATHSALTGSSAHVSFACLMLSDNLLARSSGVAGELAATDTNRRCARTGRTKNDTTF